MTDAAARQIDELVGRSQTGDREAFSQLVRMYMPRVSALTFKMTGDREMAADLAQETFVSAWTGLAAFRREASFGGWLYRIATNKTLNLLEKEKRRSGSGTPIEEPVAATTPEIDLEQTELRRQMLLFMQSLPPQQRAVFELRFYKQLSFEETAAASGKALGTVKTLFREAVRKLREVARREEWV